MTSLSQKQFGELIAAYGSVYASKGLEFETLLDEFSDDDLDNITDEYIEEQIEEFFNECIEEGLDIEAVEQTICESIDCSLDLLIERVDPKETQRRRDQAKDRLATGAAMKKAAAASSSSSDGDSKRASTLSRIKDAVKKGAKAAVKGAAGAAGRAVGTAKRASSVVSSAYSKGKERGEGGSSSSTPSTQSSSTSNSNSGDGGSSSTTPAKKGGLLKRALKKVVRGAAKAVSVGAGAVKAGADYAASRARKEHMNYNELLTIQELYNNIAQKSIEPLNEATAMAKRGYDEAPIRQKIAKSTGGGAAADRASALEKKSTFGDAKKAKQRTDYARKQRGDFRKTTSSSPGLHVGQHKSDDAGVKAKQAARGAQRGALTPAEKKQFNREEFDAFDVVLEFLQAEGYAETLEEAEWMMANIIDEKAIAIIAESSCEDDEDEKEMKKGKKSKKSKEDEEEELDEAFKAWFDEAMTNYEKNRKRAAQRAAARNEARKQGKTGAVPGVGYVTPRPERETWTDESGKTRHAKGL